MTTDRLKQHYEEKYAHEVTGNSRIVDLKPFPADRFEACVHYMHRSFRGGDILEVGGGDGTVARSLMETALPFASYTLTDLSVARATGAARAMDDSRFEGHVLDIESGLGSLTGRRYDAIIMTALIEHLIDPIASMKSLRQLLSDDGFIYVDTPNLAKYTRRIKLLFGRFPSTASKNEGLTTYDGRPVDLYDEGHLHYFTFNSLCGMLKKYCGFSRFEKAPHWVGISGGLPAPMRHGMARTWPEMFSELAIIARP